ncbi:monovalent cation/H+ antiporter subunit E [Halorubrum vacuolatum]|uniref:monovalent cation/H+ antiporter subunit E n=1 Tax=Halorubrum vacuolatum TaxID=63740 RepID=UPI001C5286DC|nr:monovalent cation/H+ antiporter subunit E [Halorubrum vacuolatum]
MTGVLVPVNPSRTLSDTITYAAREAAATDGELHLVRTVPGHYVTEAPPADVLAQLEESAEVANGEIDDLVVHTAALGADVYVSGPREHAGLIIEYAEDHDVDRVIVDPSYSLDATAPELYSIERVFRGLPIAYEHALVESSSRVPTRGEFIRGGVIGVIAFLFYIALGGPTYPFALATGVVTALIAAILLRNVSFESTPAIGSALRIAARSAVFVPFLLWEITKANVQFAYVVLHPSLPIDPYLDEVEMAVGSGLSVTAVANAITLTPGTLTVDADGHHLLVHSLNGAAREDLLDGLHEGAVRNLFYGSDAVELSGPGERGDYQPIAGPAAVTDGGESIDGSEFPHDGESIEDDLDSDADTEVPE